MSQELLDKLRGKAAERMLNGSGRPAETAIETSPEISHLALLQEKDERIAELEAGNAQLRGMVQAWMAKAALYDEPPSASDRDPITKTGPFLALSSVDRINCQIWHSPGLTVGDFRKHKTTWSLRFEVYVDVRRVQIINVNLYRPESFLKHKKKARIGMPDQTRRWIDQMAEGELLGMVLAKPKGAGTKWCPDQVAIMLNHELGRPGVILVLGDDVIEFSQFRDGHGGSASRWFADWKSGSL